MIGLSITSAPDVAAPLKIGNHGSGSVVGIIRPDMHLERIRITLAARDKSTTRIGSIVAMKLFQSGNVEVFTDYTKMKKV